MATVSTISIEKKYYKDHEVKLNSDKIKKIYSDYKEQIKKNSALSKIPEAIILSFIFIESGGKKDAISPANAYGLMQLTVPTAQDALMYEFVKDRITNDEKNYMKSLFGKKYNDIINAIKTRKAKNIPITKEDLLDPNINIFIGSIYLGQLIDYFTEDSEIRIDKVVVAYNTGKYSTYTKKIKPIKGGTIDLISMLPKETSDYVIKLVGKNGVLDTAVEALS